MSYFTYKAVDPDGAVVSGITEAENSPAAFASLSTQGLSIIYVRRANAVAAFLAKAAVSRKIKRPEVIELAANLSVMLKAGVPIITAFEDLSGTLESRYLKGAVGDMRSRIESGMHFSDAIEAQGALFPGILLRLIRTGEETGRLDASLADAAKHLQKMEALSQAIKRALIYPAVTVVMMTIALLFWLAYVLPKVVDLIEGMGVKMPVITRMLLRASSFTKVYWYAIPLAIAAVIAAVNILKRNAAFRYYIDLLKIRLPILKLVVYNKLLALFSEQLRILVMSGITIDRSLGVVADAMGNEVFKRALLESKESVSAGNSVAESLKVHKEFPQMVIRMIRIGETSGNLEEQLGFLSDYYLKRLDDISEKMGKIVEPLVLSIVGIIFVIMVFGLMLPVYDLITHLVNK